MVNVADEEEFLKVIKAIVNEKYKEAINKVAEIPNLEKTKNKIRTRIIDNSADGKSNDYEYFFVGLINLMQENYEAAEADLFASNLQIAKEYYYYIESYFSSNKRYLVDQKLANSLVGLSYQKAQALIKEKQDKIDAEREQYESTYPYLFNVLIAEVKKVLYAYKYGDIITKFKCIENFDDELPFIYLVKEELRDDPNVLEEYKPLLDLVSKSYLEGLKNLNNTITEKLEIYNINNNELKKEQCLYKEK